MNRNIIDFWVGVFVTGGFVSLFVLALKVGNVDNFSKQNSYIISSEFENIGGLKIKAPVKSAGVLVGRVEKILFNNDEFKANVIMRISNKYIFPKDSSASILTSGLLGEKYVGIEPGGDLSNLVEGDKIRLTQSAVVLEKIIGQFLYNKASETGKKN